MPEVIIGTGRDDPRKWVAAAYMILDTIERGETGEYGVIPPRSAYTRQLDSHHHAVTLAHRELVRLGIIRRIANRYYATGKTDAD